MNPDEPIDQASLLPPSADKVSVLRWFVFYGLFLLAVGIPLVLMLAGEHSWSDWRYNFAHTFASTSSGTKLMFMLVYASLATTYMPLPTGFLIAGMATQQAAVADNVWMVTLLIAFVGAVASTIANLNDYHFFTWLLRSSHVAKLRHTKFYDVSARWFARSPFYLLVLFNIIPIPVDVVRLLAITYRYGRLPFAAANFIGRFVRYAVIAFVTYYFNLGWVAPVALLGLAMVLGLIKAAPALGRRIIGAK